MVTKQKSNLLIFLGLLFVVLIKAISHYAHFGDITEGVLMGAGFGLIVMGLFGKRPRHTAPD